MQGKRALLALGILPALAHGGTTATFEDLPLTVPPLVEYTGEGGGVYYNGSDGAGGFESGGIYFETAYDTQFGSWSGWGYATTSDTVTGDYTNDTSPITGTAASGVVHAIGYYSAFGATPTIVMPGHMGTPVEMKVTNATYPYISMRDGDAFAKQFAEGDYFKMILTGYTSDESELGTVEVYLADYRAETDPNVLVSDWITVDLMPLMGDESDTVSEIRMTFESTDVGAFGINTPTYVAVDDLVVKGFWGHYEVEVSGWVDTGAFLGWVYPNGDYIWIESVQQWAWLPESMLSIDEGSWMYLVD